MSLSEIVSKSDPRKAEQEFSLATEKYLRPLPKDKLGEAILHVTCDKNGEHFFLEIYEIRKKTIIDEVTNQPKEVDSLVPPVSLIAHNFVTNRFLHGYQVVQRKGCYHPIYKVAITDMSIMLINRAWTGKKIISEVAKPFIQRIFLREYKAEMNAKRTAEFKLNKKVPTSQWFDEHDKWLASVLPSQFVNPKALIPQQLASIPISELFPTIFSTTDLGTDFLSNKEIELVEQIEIPGGLSPYQKTAAFNCCQSKSYAFFCEPGTGKTAMMIRKIDYVIDHSLNNRETRILICCPKSIRQNWINELKKFCRNYEKLAIVQLHGNNPTERVVNFLSEVTEEQNEGKHIVLVTGYESFVQTEKIHKMEWDVLAFDESHNCANPGTKRTKCFLSLRKNFEHVVIATGTPFRNTPFDIFPQFELLGEGYSGFDSYSSFKEFYGKFNQFNNGLRKLEGFQNIPLLQEKMAKHAFIIKKEEALPFLPKKTFSILETQMDREQLKVYMQLCQQLAAEIESYGPDPDTITVNNILTQMLRLAQITSGYAATDAGTITRFDPNPKLDLLIDCLVGSKNTSDEFGSQIDGVLTDPNRKAIVWCCFKENLKMIQSRLQLEGIQSVCFHGSTDGKDDVITRFNCDPTCRVFIGIAASGGVGLNLVGFDPYNPDKYTTNTTDTFNYSSNWSMVNRLQSIDRAHRHNTRVPQHVTDLLVSNSIDFEIYGRLEAKSQMSMTMQDIKKILSVMIKKAGE